MSRLTSFSASLTDLASCTHEPLRVTTSVEDAQWWWETIKTCSPQARREHLRWLGRNDVYFLLCYLLRRPDCRHPWYFARAAEIMEEPNNCCDFWPRGAGKSTILSMALPIQDAINYPDESTCFFSHNRPIARSLLNVVKFELESNVELIELYPEVFYRNPKSQSPKWSDLLGCTVKRTVNTPECTFEAWGLIEGMPHRKHYNRRTHDDVITDTTVTNPEMIAKATEMWGLSQALATGQRYFRVVGTFYADGDTYETIEAQHLGTTRIRPPGFEGLYPPSLGPDELAKIRKQMSATPRQFALQFLLDRDAAREQNEAAGFKDEWIQYERNAPNGLHYYIGCDPAGGKEQSTSKTAMWVVGLSADRRYHVVDGLVQSLDLPKRWQALKRLILQYKPLAVLYENFSMQADVQYFTEKMKEENVACRIISVGGYAKKEVRIDRLMSPFSLGKMVFPKDGIWQTVNGIKENIVTTFVEQEYRRYPVGRQKDQLDCLARFLNPT